MFKVSGADGATLKMAIATGGQGPSINLAFDSTFTKLRSWHEIFPGGPFNKSDNHLVVEASGGP